MKSNVEKIFKKNQKRKEKMVNRDFIENCLFRVHNLVIFGNVELIHVSV